MWELLGRQPRSAKRRRGGDRKPVTSEQIARLREKAEAHKAWVRSRPRKGAQDGQNRLDARRRRDQTFAEEFGRLRQEMRGGEDR